MTPLLEIRDLACHKAEGQPIFSNINFSVNHGDVVVIRGASGSGKTTLLKCLAHLNLYTGSVFYKGKTPHEYGIPAFRTEVMYIPQRPSLLPRAPRDFVLATQAFYSRRNAYGGNKGDLTEEEIQQALEGPMRAGQKLGIGKELWERDWAELSGGEGQRIMLAIGASLGTADILLFDEPTSALDIDSTLRVEEFVSEQVDSHDSKLKAIVWITHSEDQARRVGNSEINQRIFEQ